jgi:hypothetical protein
MTHLKRATMFVTVVAGVLILGGQVAYSLPLTGCVAQQANANQQTCTIVEPMDITNNDIEAPIIINSLFSADLRVGYVAILDPGDGATISDRLVFVDSGNGFAGTIKLCSDGFRPVCDVTGLTLLGTLVEPAEDVFNQSVSINLTEGSNLQFTDTFIVFSDTTPEPSTLLLVPIGLLALRLRRHKRQVNV